MKKLLLSTTVLVAAGAVSANAAEWNVRVGGYSQQAFGYANVDSDLPGAYSGADVKSDTEIWFLPKITLDNGIEFGANVQLEGNTDGDQIDESFVFIQGSFGNIDIGSENSAGYKMTYAAPDVGFITVNSGDQSVFGPVHASAAQFRRTNTTTYLENGGNNDATRLTYYTPRIAGFQVGASYARDGRQDDNAQVNRKAELSDIFDVSANYVQSFGAFNVAASGRWGTANQATGGDARIWSTGLNVGFAGFTIGGSFAQQSGTSDGLLVDGEAWDVGASYATGPWAASVAYFNGDNDDLGHDTETINGTVTYAVGPGVKANFTVGYSEATNGVTALDEDIFYIVTGVDLRF